MSLHERHRFLVVAGTFEGGLAFIAIAVGWLAGMPLASVSWSAWGVFVGGAAALPLFLVFLFSFQDPFLGMRRIRELLLELLGPSLAACRWYDLLLLATLAGVGEELLFRGLLQPWFERAGGYAVGLCLSSVLFGLAHAVTVSYAIAAGAVGLLLGWLLDATGRRNVLVPIVTHALYDFLAFLVIAAAYRTEERQRRRVEEEQSLDETRLVRVHRHVEEAT